jgi:DNA-binding NarL/FixJ family response regulator
VSVRVLIVDDHELVRAGFVMVLEGEPGVEVVGEAADGAAGVAAVGPATTSVAPLGSGACAIVGAGGGAGAGATVTASLFRAR